MKKKWDAVKAAERDRKEQRLRERLYREAQEYIQIKEHLHEAWLSVDGIPLVRMEDMKPQDGTVWGILERARLNWIESVTKAYGLSYTGRYW